MFPYDRLTHIFLYIYNHTFSTPDALANTFALSSRTIRNDILIINDILMQKKAGATISNKRSKGYYLQINNIESFNDFIEILKSKSNLDFSDVNQRIFFILQTLLSCNGWVSIDELAESMYVSSLTLKQNLKQIAQLCSNYKLFLDIKGIKKAQIIGQENDKRKLLISLLQSLDKDKVSFNFSNMEKFLFKDLDLIAIKHDLDSFFSNNDISCSDYNQHTFLIHICLSILRSRQGFYLENQQYFSEDIPIKKSFFVFLNQLENNYDCLILPSEREYLFKRLIANTKLCIDKPNKKNVLDLAKKTIDLIYKYYSFDLKSDNRLINDLFNHYYHLLSSRRFSIQKRNPLLQTVKINFSLAFDIALTTVTETFNSINISLPEDEIAYISLHIGAAIERCFSGRIKNKNVLLVCDNEKSIIRMVEARINSYFNKIINIQQVITLKEYEKLIFSDLSNIDFIITTHPIQNNYVPVVLINFLLMKDDIENISYQINKITNKEFIEVKKFFYPQLFDIRESCHDKTTLLNEMCKRLQELGFVEETFYGSILKRESLSSTALEQGFALPHPTYLQAKKSCIYVTLLKEPLNWSNETKVQIVFLLALEKSPSSDFEHLYSLIVEIINNKNIQNMLINSESFESFITHISHILDSLNLPIVIE